MLDRADPWIPCRRRGERLHHGGDVCGIVVLVVDGTFLSRTQKNSIQNLLYREMSTRSGSNLVLRVLNNFYSYTCNNIYKLIVSSMYKTFLNYNLLY